jgi:hypothetical protein
MSQPGNVPCPQCGRSVALWMRCACPICAKEICQHCGHSAYGRVFCSLNCGAYFFHGDADAEEDSADEG